MEYVKEADVKVNKWDKKKLKVNGELPVESSNGHSEKRTADVELGALKEIKEEI